MIAGLKGRLATGQVIKNIEGYGADRTVLWPRIVIADRERELRWRGRLWGVPSLFVGNERGAGGQSGDGMIGRCRLCLAQARAAEAPFRRWSSR